jgi:kinesin family protein 3/17
MTGIMPRAFETVFAKIQCDTSGNRQYLVRASYIELYKEDVRDLLSANPKAKLELREKPDSGVYVKDLTTNVVTSVDDLKKIQFKGRNNRTTAETAMNDHSSRSHALFTITIETSEPGVDGKPRIRAGKLHMVDLAGSERQSKTGAVGERLEEATKINLSLSTLCHVISTLVDAKEGAFIPYRNSKLTRLLQDSLGGNTKTVMISNIGPADYNYEESLNTLRYASRAKFITNKPRINEDPKDAMIRKFQEEIEELKAQLAQAGNGPEKSLPEGAGRPNDQKRAVKKNTADIDKTEEILLEQTELVKQVSVSLEKEKNEYAEKVKKQEEENKKAFEKRAEMEKALQKLEKRLNMHSENLVKAKDKELDLQRKQAALEERRINERRLAEEVKKKEEEQTNVAKKCKNLKDELEDKDKRLKNAWHKFQELKAEIRDTEELFWREREDTMNQIYEQSRHQKFLDLIIDNFIPESEKDKIEKCTTWDEEKETYKMHAPKFKSTFQYFL